MAGCVADALSLPDNEVEQPVLEPSQGRWIVGMGDLSSGRTGEINTSGLRTKIGRSSDGPCRDVGKSKAQERTTAMLLDRGLTESR